MTDLEQFLTDQHYQNNGPCQFKHNAVLWQKKIDGLPSCRCNGRLYVDVYVYNMADIRPGWDVEIEIYLTAETLQGDWVKLEFLCITKERVMEALPYFERCLIAAWSALNEARDERD